MATLMREKVLRILIGIAEEMITIAQRITIVGGPSGE